jgi:diadenosine tetraphosphate (Ap4A) HIT family hydrolase
MNIGSCRTCRSISGEDPISPGGRIAEGSSWIVEHAYPTSLRGWVVIVLRRHAEALHELTPEEFTELATLQDAVAGALRAETGCVKEYVACFAEAEGFSHLHLHVIPRGADIPADLVGPKVFGYLGAEGALDEAVVIETSARLRELVSRS